ncbi:His-Xaa-Ser system protein HxsD [Clostridium estertheticum]|uniref:His-Xaa-Ser system protein HxsD n=1 Tax=Clostridium estertheticum TaxID=238834 RepID=A0A5N7ILX8_9CLOT|nr:His-Xaa-Ser system protein HxsD [Clostridium estertheticum]MPQ31320.1 His-Xaa-Ser system protein HxsD [Clostridium estertheticum]MPQ61994.1 His-Xaa-Ser system protein HxsD [Clostridium estertheticum]
MNIEYKYHPNKAIFNLNSKIYELSCIMKAAYNFIDEFYVFFDYESEDTIRVDFKSKQTRSSKEVEIIIGEFCNELLNQSIRYKVSKETKNVRELILGRALYDTCIEDKEDKINNLESDNNKELNFSEVDYLNIGTNWLDKHEDGDN